MATCNKQHRYLEGFNELPEAQDNRNGGRHICAACAYEKVQLPPITLDINMVKKLVVKQYYC